MSIGEGQKIGNYNVLSKLGVGGMGAVYLAEHPLIGKRVALKVIHKELAGNQEVVTRFFNEARAVNKIGNEHIVEIHDFGQTPEGEHFFIMEYLHGRTLAQVLDNEGVLSPQRALHIGAQIAHGLAAAHSCGIIHRDLKPDNIMLIAHLGDNDFVKVLDFGLAKMFADTGSQQLTAVGVVLGTPQYMSPEACESKRDIDHRSDIYSMGVLLYQMLTGRVPFDGNSMGEVLVQQVTQAPPAPRGINPHIPPSVEQIVLRCLAKPTDARFPTMHDLRTALLDPDRYLASSPPVVPSAPIAAAASTTMFQQPAPNAAPPPPNPADSRAFALKPPPPSIAGAKTVFPVDGHAPTGAMAPAQAPAPATSPVSAAAGMQTAFMDAPAPPPGRAEPTASQIAMSRKATAVPMMEQPREAENMTMMIDTPPGHFDKPPAKKWPVVAALLSVLVVIGGGIGAIVMLGGEDKKAEAAGVVRDDSGNIEDGDNGDPLEDTKGDTKPDTTKVAAKPMAAAPKVAVIKLTTSPTGAGVYDSRGKKLGTTPTTLEYPRDGKRHRVTFKHPKAKTRKKTLVASGDTEINVELEVSKRSSSRKSSRKRSRSKKSDRKSKKPPKKTKTTKPNDDMMQPTFD